MKIKCKKPGVKRIFNRKISDEGIDFKNGVATVSKEVGEQLIATYPDLAKVKSKAKYKED